MSRRTLIVARGARRALAGPAFASPRSGAALRLQRIGAESGLSHNSVYSLLQDRQGFLWVGTVDGLNRYDGYEFVTYRHDPLDGASLSNQVVHCLLEDRHEGLWIGTEDGLNRFDRRAGRFARYVLGTAPAVRQVWAFWEDRSGQLWAGTDQGLFRYDRAGDRFRAHPLARPPAEVPGAIDVSQLGEDSKGTLWALSVTYRGAGAMLHPVARTGPPNPAFRIPSEWGPTYRFLIDDDDRFWFQPIAPAVIDPITRQIVPPPRGLKPLPVLALLKRSDGTLWAGSEEGLIELDPRSGLRRLHPLGPPGGGWLDNSVRALIEDRAGAMWVGTYAGLHRHDPHAKRFARWRHDPMDPRSLSSNAVSALYREPSGILWIGTFGHGLNRFDASRGAAQRFRNRPGDRTSLRNDVVWSIHGEPDGTLWIATEAGLCTLDPRRDRFVWRDLDVPPDPRRTEGLRITSIVRDSRGVLWMAGFAGLYSLEPRTGVARHHALGEQGDLRMHAVTSVLPLEDGTIWAGSGTLGLVRLEARTGERRRYPLTLSDGRQLRSEGVWTLHRDGAGRLWLGTGAGLSRFDPRTESFSHFFPRDGLPGSVVYSLIEDRRGRLWLGTNRGLSRFDPSATVGRGFRNYDLSDGIGSMEFNRNVALVDPDGRFFFGGVDGLTAFTPEEIQDDPHPPPVVLTRIQSSSREGTVSHNPFGRERLTLSYRDYSFAFEFAAFSYANPARNQYAYLLEGFDRGWVSAGTQRLARYTSVPPGSYTFRLRSSNQDGLWNEKGVALPVTITPPYWQTPWFRALVAALALGLLAAAYRYRVAKLIEMERLRLRIASDLHDDLSSDLSAIAVVTDMMQRRSGLAEAERSRLAELRDKALEMVGAVRDTVWYVQPEHDTVDAMVRRMRAAAVDLLGETPCAFELGMGDGRAAIPMAARRELFLIYKELIHNVARHARARQVTVSFRESAGRATLRVSDDGVGFDPGGVRGGEGLRSMRRRAERMGADLEILSRPGEGTAVTLVVDLARTRDGGRAGARL